MSELRPTAGARFVLELGEVRAGGGAASYRTAIYVPDAEWTGTAELHDDGEVQLGELGAPKELGAKLAVIAKLVARGVAARRLSGEKPWPARVMRWRGPKG